MDKKSKKKPRQYSIFVVPEGSPTSRRWRIHGWVPNAIGLFATVWVIVTIALVAATSYYRNGWLSTADVRQENAEIKSKEANVNEKLIAMEETVSRADRLASRLETALGIDKKVMTKNIGPISKRDDLPDAEKLTLFERDKLTVGKGEGSSAAFDGVALKMDELNEVVASVEMRLQEVYDFRQGKLAYWASIPSVWPVRGWVTSGFGVRRRPHGVGSRVHEGIDIAASSGTTVYAPGDGTVTFSGMKKGLGRTVIIDHGFGVFTVYGHASKLYVKEGERVKRGSTIAAVGRSGRATGPHLHYEVVIDGVPVDPMRYIIENF